MNAPAQHLSEVREWARYRLNARTDKPWTWYQLMKLVEAADALLEEMGAKPHPPTTARPPAIKPAPAKKTAKPHLRLVPPGT